MMAMLSSAIRDIRSRRRRANSLGVIMVGVPRSGSGQGSVEGIGAGGGNVRGGRQFGEDEDGGHPHVLDELGEIRLVVVVPLPLEAGPGDGHQIAEGT